ncbi:MAG: DUF418 domain-containing protein [Actinomycetales bacterium]
MQLLVQQRFFPIFSLLFGMSFALLLESARGRSPRPRAVLARRLLVLLPLGVLHQFLHPGEALTSLAVFGLLVLLPSSWLPRWVVAAGAAVLVSAAVLVAGGGLVLVPGLLLLGSALVRYGVVDRLEVATRGPAILFAVFTAASVPALAPQVQDIRASGFSTASAVAGLAMAGAYTTGLLLALHTPVRGALHAVFAPLGRMALTNYVAATPLMILAGRVLDWRHGDSWAQVLTVAAVILLGQWVASAWWLRHYRQGPLEYLWRWATWLERPPLRRAP